MGDRNTTVQNLEIEKIDLEDNLLLIKGAVPGSIGSFVKVTPSIKDGAKLSLVPIVDEVVENTAPVEEAAPAEDTKEAAPVEEAAPAEDTKKQDESEKE